MDRLAPLGRVFVATSLTAFGVQQFLFGDFVPGRAPAWPASLPGRLPWAWATGAFFVVAGVAIVSRRWARSAAVLAGALIFAWAFLRNIPLALAATDFGGAWTRLGKALALFGGSLAVAGSLPASKHRAGEGAPSLMDSRDGFLTLGRFCLGSFLAVCGVQHFLFVPFVTSLVPGWIPGPRVWTYATGVFLIAGGVGLMFRRLARLAGALSGLMVGLWVVLLHVPRALSAVERGAPSEWIAVFEALAMSGIALVLAGALRSSGSAAE
jgi:uncharacterized membrane protein